MSFAENYVLPNPDEKYDIIPEIWQGHNIADYVDPDIRKVSVVIVLLTVTICVSLFHY